MRWHSVLPLPDALQWLASAFIHKFAKSTEIWWICLASVHMKTHHWTDADLAGGAKGPRINDDRHKGVVQACTNNRCRL